MSINTIKKFLFACLFLYLPVQSIAWGVLGHRIVGQIAESYLTATAKTAIHKILGDESIAMASNWPDFVRSDPAYDYLTSWHHINFDDGFTYNNFQAYLKKDTIADAYTRLNFIIKQLQNKNLSVDKKKFYLKLLIHIAGDVHQPMHAGRKEDLGGNTIKLLWFNESTNLHRIWDEQLINFQQLSYTEYTKAINHTTLAQRQKWQKQTLGEWIFESYVISRQIYSGITKPIQKLSYRYNFDNIQSLNQQLLKGGVRLAGILNKLFG